MAIPTTPPHGSDDGGAKNGAPKTLTTQTGRPVGDNQNSMTAGARGPVLLQDFQLFEKMAQFNRERIPERVVHAKGSGALRHFHASPTTSRKYTSAKLFAKVGKQTPDCSRASPPSAARRARPIRSAIRAASR